MTSSTMAFLPPIPPKSPWYAMIATPHKPPSPPVPSRNSFIKSPMDKSTANCNNKSEIILKMITPMMMLIASLDKTISASLFYDRISSPQFPRPPIPSLVLLSPPRTHPPLLWIPIVIIMTHPMMSTMRRMIVHNGKRTRTQIHTSILSRWRTHPCICMGWHTVSTGLQP